MHLVYAAAKLRDSALQVLFLLLKASLLRMQPIYLQTPGSELTKPSLLYVHLWMQQ